MEAVDDGGSRAWKQSMMEVDEHRGSRVCRTSIMETTLNCRTRESNRLLELYRRLVADGLINAGSRVGILLVEEYSGFRIVMLLS